MKPVALLAATALFTLTLSACGGSDEEAVQPAADTAATTGADNSSDTGAPVAASGDMPAATPTPGATEATPVPGATPSASPTCVSLAPAL